MEVEAASPDTKRPGATSSCENSLYLCTVGRTGMGSLVMSTLAKMAAILEISGKCSASRSSGR
eukprot:11965583-Ditylum_brightwellii.AAC.1